MYLNVSNRAHGAAEVTPEVCQCNVTEMLQIMQSIIATTLSKMLFSGSLTLDLNSSLAATVITDEKTQRRAADSRADGAE